MHKKKRQRLYEERCPVLKLKPHPQQKHGAFTKLTFIKLKKMCDQEIIFSKELFCNYAGWYVGDASERMFQR